ncbi:hypothetical protein CRE_19955 [Caenorhabditis remanei]|uniref:Reverse transcriptase domain-containing protein n=1 Tax=Caenorhabditis remanei TaxID=31234 RepID=E3N8I0_CAERE|nr:hypothetical protein CRE_19955 [Caenorhabditis remanei]
MRIRYRTLKQRSFHLREVFTTFDLLARYWQLPLKEESEEITAFAIGSEFFEWNVLLFGLATSPAIFQAAMECVVGDLLGTCVFVYVDDLLIASENMKEHAIHVQTILERIERSGMELKASKCWIAKEEVDYLDFHNEQKQKQDPDDKYEFKTTFI